MIGKRAPTQGRPYEIIHFHSDILVQIDCFFIQPNIQNPFINNEIIYIYFLIFFSKINHLKEEIIIAEIIVDPLHYNIIY